MPQPPVAEEEPCTTVRLSARMGLVMPELPEVETMCRGIAAIVGSTITGMVRPRSKLRPIAIVPPPARFRRRVTGRRVEAIGRVGKRVVIVLESGDRIVIEPRMTGRVLLAEPPDRTHLRVVFQLSGGPGRQVMFWDSRRLGSRRRAIKVALLDQRALASVGNLYASELLHRAGIHPAVPCNRLRPADWPAIHAARQELLREAIELQGSTLADGNYPAENRPGSFQERHRVWGAIRGTQ